MLDRINIRNAAILKPRFIKCRSLQMDGRHAWFKTAKGYEQCADCGKIKKEV